MAQGHDDRKWVYDQLVNNGYTEEYLGTEEDFLDAMKNSDADRKWAYGELKNLGYTENELGSKESFYADLASDDSPVVKTPAQAQVTDKEKADNVQLDGKEAKKNAQPMTDLQQGMSAGATMGAKVIANTIPSGEPVSTPTATTEQTTEPLVKPEAEQSDEAEIVSGKEQKFRVGDMEFSNKSEADAYRRQKEEEYYNSMRLPKNDTPTMEDRVFYGANKDVTEGIATDAKKIIKNKDSKAFDTAITEQLGKMVGTTKNNAFTGEDNELLSMLVSKFGFTTSIGGDWENGIRQMTAIPDMTEEEQWKFIDSKKNEIAETAQSIQRTLSNIYEEAGASTKQLAMIEHPEVTSMLCKVLREGAFGEMNYHRQLQNAYKEMREKLPSTIEEQKKKLTELADKEQQKTTYSSVAVGGASAVMMPNETSAKKDADVALRMLNNATTIMDFAKKNAGRKWDDQLKGQLEDMGVSFFKSLTDLSTWDFGASDLKEATRVKMLLDKQDKGETLTESENALLDAICLNTAVNMYYGKQVSDGVTVGQTTAEMLPFMIQIAMTPGAGASEAAGKAVLKKMVKRMASKNFVQKYLGETTKRMLTKAPAIATSLGVDVARGALTANTWGLPSTLANAVERQIGQVEINPFTLEYTGREGEDDALTAFLKAEGSATIENQSEAFGRYIDRMISTTVPSLGNWAIKTFTGSKSEAFNRLGDLLKSVKTNVGKLKNSSELYQFLTTARKQGKLDQPVGEYLEEVVGNVENALLGIDMSFDRYEKDENGEYIYKNGKKVEKENYVFDLHDNVVTAVSVTVPAIVGSVIQYASLGASGINKMRKTRNWARGKMEDAVNDGIKAFGEETWNEIQEIIDNGIDFDSDNFANAVAQVADLYADSEETAKTIANYAKRKMAFDAFNKTEEAITEAKSNEGESVYNDGVSVGEGLETPDAIYTESKKYKSAEEAMLTSPELVAIKQNIDYIMDNGQGAQAIGDLFAQIPEEYREQANAYLEARSTMEGMQNRADAKVEEAVRSEEERIKPNIGSDGTITTVMYGGQPYFVRQYSPEAQIAIIVDMNNGEPITVYTDIDDKFDIDSVTEISAEDHLNNYREEQEALAGEELNNAVYHNPYTNTQLNVGDMIPTANGIMYVFANDGTTVQLLPTKADVESGQMIPVSGQPTEVSIDDALVMQDELLDEKYGFTSGSYEKEEVQPIDDITEVEPSEEPVGEPSEEPVGETDAVQTTRQALVDAGLEEEARRIDNGEFLDMSAYDAEDTALINDYLNALAASKAQPVQPEVVQVENGEQPEVKFDENNNPILFGEGGVDEATAMDFLYNKYGLEPEEADAYVNAKIDQVKNGKKDKTGKKFVKEGIKQLGNKPSIADYSDDIAGYKTAKAEWEAKNDALQAELAYWEMVKNLRETVMNEAKQEEAVAQGGEVAQGEDANIPDILNDNPADARVRGKVSVNGVIYNRQEKTDGIYGKEATVIFSTKKRDTQKGRMKLVPLSQLQSSHTVDGRNPLHFLPEAQPKNRASEDSKVSALNNAKPNTFNPEQTTGDGNAYLDSSPTVNKRGEVIQGNGRVNMFKVVYSNDVSTKKYLDYLKDNAEKFGFKREDIEALERAGVQPVLVNEIDVDDDTAIRLGQYTAQDLESGGEQRIKPSQFIKKAGNNFERFINILMRGDEDMSIAQRIDENGLDAMKLMNQLGVINDTEMASIIKNGKITPEGKNDINNILKERLYDGAPTTLKEQFESLPAKAQSAILSTYFRDLNTAEEAQLIGDIRSAIQAFYDLTTNSKEFAKATKYEDAKGAISDWLAQNNMFSSVANSEKFSTFALELAARMKTSSQKGLTSMFNEYYDLVQGSGEMQDMFSENQNNTPLRKSEAIKKLFNIDIEENGKEGSNAVDSDSETGTEGGRRGEEPNPTGEEAQTDGEPADTGGGDSESDVEGIPQEAPQQTETNWEQNGYDTIMDTVKNGRTYSREELEAGIAESEQQIADAKSGKIDVEDVDRHVQSHQGWIRAYKELLSELDKAEKPKKAKKKEESKANPKEGLEAFDEKLIDYAMETIKTICEQNGMEFNDEVKKRVEDAVDYIESLRDRGVTSGRLRYVGLNDFEKKQDENKKEHQKVIEDPKATELDKTQASRAILWNDFLLSCVARERANRHNKRSGLLKKFGVKKNTELTEKQVDDLFYAMCDDEETIALYKMVQSIVGNLGIQYNTIIGKLRADADSSYGGVIRYNIEKLTEGYVNPNDIASTILHEKIHQIEQCVRFALGGEAERVLKSSRYSKALKDKVQHIVDSITPEQREAWNEISQLYDLCKKDPNLFKGTFNGRSYAMKNEGEFIAEWSNPKHRAELKKKGIWKKYVKAILKLFGIKTDGAELETAYETMERAFNKLCDSFTEETYYTFRAIGTGKPIDEVKPNSRQGRTVREVLGLDDTINEKSESRQSIDRYVEAEDKKGKFRKTSSNELYKGLLDDGESYEKAVELARRILSGETEEIGGTAPKGNGTQSLLGTAAAIIARRSVSGIQANIRSYRGERRYLAQQEANKKIMKNLLEFAKQGNLLVDEVKGNYKDGRFGTPVLMLNGEALTEGAPFSYHAESRVFMSPDGKSVIKQGHAKGADRTNLTIADRLSNMLLFNKIFEDTPHELLGVRDSGNGNCELIWRQNRINGTELQWIKNPDTGTIYTVADRKKMLDTYMHDVLGFDAVVSGKEELYTDGFLDIDDVRTNHENIIVREDGQMFIIDGFVRNAESDYLGDIMRSEVDFVDNEQIDSINDYSDHIIGNEGASMIDAEYGTSVFGDLLAEAKQMEKDGVDTVDIWRKTGWERGKDGKWRTEIPDMKIKGGEVKLTRGKTLDKVFDADELFDAYPSLKGITIKRMTFSELMETDADAMYDHDEGVIKVLLGDDNILGEAQLPIILHEIQHAIQYEEGFATGSSESQVRWNSSKIGKQLKEQVDNLSSQIFAKEREERERIADEKGWSKYMRKSHANELANEALKNLKENDSDYVMLMDKFKEVYGRYAALMHETGNPYYQRDKFRDPMKMFDIYRAHAGEVEARNASRRHELTDEQRNMMPPSSTEDFERDEQILIDGGGLSFHKLEPKDSELSKDDKEAIKEFKEGKTKTVYRAMQVIDGKLYPPMAARVGGELVEGSKKGDILKADEHPEMIKMVNGKPQFVLDKGGKDATGKSATSVPARYNPYWHTSNSVLNDQFKSAWIRPNMVVVECEIPVMELTSGYKAEYAKDAVGMVSWKSGVVTNQLVKQGHPGREVYLSRYCKIGNMLTDAQAAQKIKEFIGDKDVEIPVNTVTPKLRAELEKLGVKIGAPEKGVKMDEQIQEALEKGLKVDNTLAEEKKPTAQDILLGRVNAKDMQSASNKGRNALENRSIGSSNNSVSEAGVREKLESSMELTDKEHATSGTYTSKDGKKTSFVQLPLGIGEDEKTPADFVLRPLKEGETCYVERRYEENKMFTFTGNEIIESPDDIAYMFRCLEDSAIEHTFMVLLKNGKPTIIHTGMGQIDGSNMDTIAPKVAIDNINPDYIIMVHNHPSGKLNPSMQDRMLHEKLQAMYGDKLRDSIIIDQKSGKYAEFNSHYGNNGITRPTTARNESEYKVYSFSKNVFSPDYSFEGEKMTDYFEVAKFISSHRLGNRGKLGFIIASNRQTVNGNVLLDANEITDKNYIEVAQKIVSDAASMSGKLVFLYGSGGMTEAVLNKLQTKVKQLSGGQVGLVDGIKIQGNNLDTVESLLYANEGGVDIINGTSEHISAEDQEFNDDLSGKNGVGKMFNAINVVNEHTATYQRKASTPSGQASIVSSAMWDAEMEKTSNQLRTVAVDHLTPLLRFQEMMQDKLGIRIKDNLNAHQALQDEPSKNLQEMQKFKKYTLRRLEEALIDLVGKSKNLFKEDSSDMKEVHTYTYAKHAVERNRQRAVEKHAEKVADTEPNFLEDWYDERDKILADDTLTWREQQLQMDALAETMGVKMEKTGSMGLAPLFGMKEDDDWRTKAYDFVEDYESSRDADKIQEYWDAIRECTDKVLDKSVESGLSDSSFKDDMHRRWQFYVPLRGFDEELAQDVYYYVDEMNKGFNGNPKVKLKERKSIADNIFGGIVAISYGTIIKGNENLAKQRFLNLARKAESEAKDLINVSEPWMIKYGELKNHLDVFEAPTGLYADDDLVPAIPILKDNMTPQQLQARMEEYHSILNTLATTDDAVVASNANKIPYRTLFKQTNQHVVTVNEGGRQYTVTILGNPAVTQAVNGMLNPGRNAERFDEIAGDLRRFMAGNLTSRNLGFVLSNLIKDTQFSMNNVWVNEDFGYLVDFYANVAKLMTAKSLIPMYFKYLKDGEALNSSRTAQLFKEFMDHGGPIGYTFTESQRDYAKQYKKDIRKLSRRATKIQDMTTADKLKELYKTPARYIANAWNAIWESVAFFAEVSELTNRFASYMTSRNAGRSISRSAHDAHEVSINFSQVGAGKQWKGIGDEKTRKAIDTAAALTSYGRNYIVFFNANIQAKYRGYENLVGNMLKGQNKKATKAVMSQIGIPTVTNALLVPVLNDYVLPVVYDWLGIGGDDDDKSYYDLLNDFTRQSKICIRLPKDMGWMTIPLDPEMVPWYTIGDLVHGIVTGKNVEDTDFTTALVDAMTPLSINWERPTEQFWMNALPSASIGLADIISNTNFLGYSIYKEDPYGATPGTPQYQRVYNSTSKSLTELSKWSNKLGGGNEIEAAGYDEISDSSSLLDWNPAKIQHILRSYFGGISDTLLGVADFVMSTSTGEELGNASMQVPVISRFVQTGSPEQKTKRLNAQYNQVRYAYDKWKKIVSRYDREYKDAVSRGDTLKMVELQENFKKKSQTKNFKMFQQLGSIGYIEEIEKVEEQIKKEKVDDKETLRRLNSIIDKYKEDIVLYYKNYSED